MPTGITKFKGLKDFYSTFQKTENAFSSHNFSTVIPFPAKSLTLQVPTLFANFISQKKIKSLEQMLGQVTSSKWFKINSQEDGPLARMQLLIQKMDIPKLSLGGGTLNVDTPLRKLQIYKQRSC